MNVQVT